MGDKTGTNDSIISKKNIFQSMSTIYHLTNFRDASAEDTSQAITPPSNCFITQTF